MARPRAFALAIGLALPAAVPSAAPAEVLAPPGFFGVTPQAPLTAPDFEAMASTGVGTLRFELSWAAADPDGAGAYDWAHSDAIVNGAAANGIDLLPFVFTTPTWVAALDGRTCGDRCASFAPRGAAALAAWRGFLAAAVQRYGPGGEFWGEHPELAPRPIRTWQLWNEQNSPTYFRPRPNVDAYARMVVAGDDAISSLDPGAEIVLGGMFGAPLGGRKPGISAPRFLARLYRRPGIEPSFDGVAAHPYGGSFGRVRAQVKRLRERMVVAGDGDTGLWITELGWASGGAPDPLNRGPRGQARRLTQSFKYFVKKRGRQNIRGVNWYSWRDNSDPDAGLCTWCPQSGLMTAELSGKPSQKAFKRFTSGS
jgi:hypothetical protein